MPVPEIETIRAHALFRDLAEEQFADLAQHAVAKRFLPHDTIVEEGDHPQFLWLVVQGAVELFSRRGRREASIGVVLPVSAFFIASTIYDLPLQASARTIEPSSIVAIEAEPLRRLFEADGGFARAILAETARSFRSMTSELKAQRLCTSVERLANWILVQDRDHSRNGQFVLPYDKRTLAGHLGMTPENLSRNFALLSDYGISVNRREVAVRDREKLAAFAEPAASLTDWEV
ncbi:helix-turn-helix domain-containing protein [Bauldia litoralis]|nr:cyclic nucleotide-binding domain-containing protein [Bauldia litoralis]